MIPLRLVRSGNGAEKLLETVGIGENDVAGDVVGANVVGRAL